LKCFGGAETRTERGVAAEKSIPQVQRAGFEILSLRGAGNFVYCRKKPSRLFWHSSLENGRYAISVIRSLVANAIFISYRRDDSEGEAGRLFDDLNRAFDGEGVFMDVAGIRPGIDFRVAIDENIVSCGVLLAIIGPRWLGITDAAGGRRLDDPNDFVALEIASALKRNVPVIPVLVHEAKMPRVDQLPEALKDLAYRNCVELTHARWNSDCQLLIRALSTMRSSPVEALPPEAAPALPADSARATAALPIDDLTRELAVFIGPVAKFVVKNLAAKFSDIDVLYAEAAKQIDSEQGRKRFLSSRRS
jgi:hypothetical protein